MNNVTEDVKKRLKISYITLRKLSMIDQKNALKYIKKKTILTKNLAGAGDSILKFPNQS